MIFYVYFFFFFFLQKLHFHLFFLFFLGMKRRKQSFMPDYSHMLTYCWKLFRYHGDSWSNNTCSKINKFTERTWFFTLLLSWHILFLVTSQTDGKLIECVKWMPREPPFTHRTSAKITEKFPSPQGSNSDLGGPLSGLKLTSSQSF